MDFYLSLEGSKAGPFSIFKIGELLESGEATPDTLAWHRDLEEWKPIGEIPALEMVKERTQSGTPTPPPPPDPAPVPPPERFAGAPLPPATREATPPAPQSIATTQVRPFVRFWARMFDYTLVSVIVLLVSDVVLSLPQPDATFEEAMSRYFAEYQVAQVVLTRNLLIAMFGWHLLEGGLIHYFGTTPGKALFGIKVTSTPGSPPSLIDSLARSFYVYALGVGFYLSPLILIGMIFSYFRLKTAGICLWDQHLKTQVHHLPMSEGRIVLAICSFFALLALQLVKYS